MYDSGNTITMQSQENILCNVVWHSSKDNIQGPLTVLLQLENATNSWKNVNNQTYRMRTTAIYRNCWTACSDPSSCATNKYTLAERTGKTSMITVSEAVSSDCTTTNSSCPIWLYNHAYEAKTYGGTIKKQ